ncbi:MAG: glycerol-3-phosphate acyltransferase [Bacteroidota bacterium]
MFLTYVVVVGVNYLIGSLPTAYLLVKWKTQQDVRKMGTGNVGALNSYEVTGSRFVGLAVLLVDLMKGAFSVLLARFLSDGTFTFLGLSALSVVVGHNYNVWLGFKGGRGLAAAAGAVLVVNWVFVAVWGALWSVTYMLTKNIHKGNVLAIVVTPFVAAFLSEKMVDWGLLKQEDTSLFIVFGFLLCTLLFLRHLQPIREMLSGKPK